jgi:hypothetical protein
MPMKRVLEEGGTFDPKAVAIRLEALNGIVAKLDWRQSPTGRRLQKFVINRLTGLNMAGKLIAFIGSENTYAMRAKIDTACFPGRRNKFCRRWSGHPSRKHGRGLSETPAGRKQRCRVRHRLGRLLVGVTYKRGTK